MNSTGAKQTVILFIVLFVPVVGYFLLKTGTNHYKALPIFGEKYTEKTIVDNKERVDTIYHRVGGINFQDQQNQQHSYKYGSLQHVDKSVRKQAIAHNLDVIKHGIDLGSKSLTVWLSDGSCFPGQLNFRKSFQHVLESLEVIYHVLPPDWKLFIEYKAIEPNFY